MKGVLPSLVPTAVCLYLLAGCSLQPSLGEAEALVPEALLRSPVFASVDYPALFSAEDSYHPGGAALRYRFDFGDGTSETVGDAAIVEHVYRIPGVYQVNVTASTADGLEAVARHDITVVGGSLPPSCVADEDCVWGDACLAGLCYFFGGEYLDE